MLNDVPDSSSTESPASVRKAAHSDIAGTLVDCAAFVSWRRIQVGQRAMLALSYDA